MAYQDKRNFTITNSNYGGYKKFRQVEETFNKITTTEIQVRRVNHPTNGDEVQFEVEISDFFKETKRNTNKSDSFSMTPEQAEQFIKAMRGE